MGQIVWFYAAIRPSLRTKTIGIARQNDRFCRAMVARFLHTRLFFVRKWLCSNGLTLAHSYVLKNRPRNLFFVFLALSEGKYCDFFNDLPPTMVAIEVAILCRFWHRSATPYGQQEWGRSRVAGYNSRLRSISSTCCITLAGGR